MSPSRRQFEDNIPMSLNGVRVYRNHFIESVQGNVSENGSGIGSSASASKPYRMLLSRVLKNLPRMLIAINQHRLRCTGWSRQSRIRLNCRRSSRSRCWWLPERGCRSSPRPIGHHSDRSAETFATLIWRKGPVMRDVMFGAVLAPTSDLS